MAKGELEAAGRRPAFNVVFLGSCRAVDQQRFEDLVLLTESFGLASRVQFIPNAPYSRVKEVLSSAVAGLHSMRDEHFGISVVEYMAAGCLPIAHASGVPDIHVGPLLPVAVPCLSLPGAPLPGVVLPLSLNGARV